MSNNHPTSSTEELLPHESRPPKPSNAPAGLISREKELNALLKWALSKVNPDGESILILSGLPGMGKSTLARQFALHPQIKATYSSYVFWIDTGVNPTDLVDQINEIGFEHCTEWSYASDLQEAIQQLYNLHAKRRILIILEDAGSVELALKFKSDTDRSRVLVITRNRRIAQAIKAPEVFIGAFEPSETKQLFQADAYARIRRLNLLDNQVIRIPLIAYLSQICTTKGVPLPAFTSDTTFEEALALLWSQLIGQYPADQRTAIYALGIFPALTPLSYPVISRLWKRILSGDHQETAESLYTDLKELRILSHRTHSNSAVTSDLFQQYVEHHIDLNLIDLHAQLLEIYPPQAILEGEVPGFDEYIYRFLPFHLWQANQTDTLFKLLLSVEWISSKIQKIDHQALQEDYSYGRSDKTIRLVDEAIRLSAPILSHDASQIISQLIGRLQQIDIKAVSELVEALRIYRSSESYWLDPWHADLKTPSSSLILSLQSHQGELLSVDVDKSNHYALSSSRDLSINVWDLTGTKLKHTLMGLTEPAQQTRFLPNGIRAVSASGPVITLWDIHKGEESRTYHIHDANILSLCPLPDNQSLLSADEKGNVYVIDLLRGEITHTLSPEQELTWALASTRNQILGFTGGNNENIQVWDLATGQHKRTLTAHEDWVWDLCVTNDERYLLSASEDQSILVWDLFAAKVVRVLKGHKAGVRFMTLAMDDTRVLSADEEQSIILWDFQTGNILRSFTGLSNWMNDFKPLTDGKSAFLATEESELKLWSMSGRQRREEHQSHDKGIRVLKLTPGGLQLISASDDATIRKWHVNTAALLDSYRGHTDWISSIDLSRDGSKLVSASFDKTVRIWDLEAGRCIRTLEGHLDWVWCAAISSDNRFIASGSEDRTVITWDIRTGKLLHALTAHDDGVNKILISSDNRHILSSSLDQTICVWKEQDGSLAHILEGHSGAIQSITLSPLGDRLVSGSDDGTIRIWNFALGMEDECLHNPGGAIREVYVLKNGYRLLSISEDHALRVWDLVSSKPIFTLQRHSSEISHLAVSNDGRWAATTGSDRQLCLWDLENGHLCDSYYADYPMTHSIFSIDGEKVIGADAGGGLHFLHVRGTGY